MTLIRIKSGARDGGTQGKDDPPTQIDDYSLLCNKRNLVIDGRLGTVRTRDIHLSLNDGTQLHRREVVFGYVLSLFKNFKTSRVRVGLGMTSDRVSGSDQAQGGQPSEKRRAASPLLWILGGSGGGVGWSRSA